MADYIVKSGDTLWAIATSYKSKISGSDTNAKVNTLVKVNSIPDRDKIYVGQALYFSEKARNKVKKTSPKENKPVVAGIGLSSTDTTGRTVFVVWNHDSKEYEDGDVDKYEYEWHFMNKDTTWWQEKSRGTTTSYGSRYRFSECQFDENASKVRFRVKPIAKPKSSEDSTPRFKNAKWSEYAEYNFANNPPLKPDAPVIAWYHDSDIDKDYLTFSIKINKIPVKKYGASHINFEIFNNNSKVDTISKVAIKKATDETGDAVEEYFIVSTKYTGKPGGEYKVRAQSVSSKNKTSGWSDFCEPLYTKPAAPSGTPVVSAKRVLNEVNGKPSVYAHVEWNKVANADHYVVEYTTYKTDFDENNASPKDLRSTDPLHSTSADIWLYDVDPQNAVGGTYYFRVKAVRTEAAQESDPSAVVTLTVGEKPAAPTAWASVKSAFAGETMEFGWTHNTKDGSLQTSAKIKMRIFDNDDNTPDIVVEDLEAKNGTYPSDTDEIPTVAVDENDNIYGWFYSYKGILRFELNTNLSLLTDKGIEWCVQTAGVTGEYDDKAWSAPDTVYIYSKPELKLSVTTDVTGENPFGTVTIPPATYYYSVIYDADNNVYSVEIDSDGDMVPVKNFNGAIVEGATADGMPVYKATVNNTVLYYCVETSGEETSIDDALLRFPFYIRAQVDLDSSGVQRPIGYNVRIVANDYYETTDDTGKTKIVNPGDEVYSKYFTAIEANTSDGKFDPLIVEMSADNVDLEPLIGYTVYCDADMSSGLALSGYKSFNVYWEDVTYTIDADVFVDLSSYTATVVPVCKDNTGEPVENVTISVYRREYDGQFTELATGVPNNGTSVPDPHPALDYARYRLIAKHGSTGAVSFYDMPGEYIGCKSIVIQWDEQWATYDVNDAASYEGPLWSGSMLVLPYNVKISDNRKRDVSRVTYAGRQYPVAYHGTAISESSNWTTVIPKDDTETIYALRRLSLWAGPVYVREPSGMGFWATVVPTFNIEGTSVSIPVTLDITRVEGGA